MALIMMVVAATLMLAALGATASDLQPSAQRVLVTAVIALIAPLFWPGKGATSGRTALTIAGWSCAVCAVAALALLLRGASSHSLGPIASVCAVLLLILVVTHALAAALEAFAGAMSGHANGAREIAGCAAALALAIVGSIPVWFGPAAELAGDSSPRLMDAVVGVSPLVHLAVASGNDLLRNQWFYQHSNLAALRYSYPGLATVATVYIGIALTFVFVPWAAALSRRTDSTATHLTTERTP